MTDSRKEQNCLAVNILFRPKSMNNLIINMKILFKVLIH
jgi:hypothetical protein